MDLKWLAAKVAAGMTDAEIALECGEPEYMVAYYRRTALGLVRRPKGRRKWTITKEELEALVKSGKSDREIADLRKMTTSGVYQYRKRFGIFRDSDGDGSKNHWVGKRGAETANWRGGRTATGSGYIRIYKPDHPNANDHGYVYEHRLVMEQKLGRLLTKDEIVDHIDRNRSNNAPDNLRVHASRSQHVKDHYSARDQMMALVTKIRALSTFIIDYHEQTVQCVPMEDLNRVLDEAMAGYAKT